MAWEQFLGWLVCGLLGLFVTGIFTFLSMLIGEIKKMREEMSKLNEKLVELVTNQEWQGREILRLEQRINDVENKDRR